MKKEKDIDFRLKRIEDTLESYDYDLHHLSMKHYVFNNDFDQDMLSLKKDVEKIKSSLKEIELYVCLILLFSFILLVFTFILGGV